MTDDEAHIEWHRAPDFAEVAEALGVTTRDIMAVRDPNSAEPMVLYAPESDIEPTLVYAITLKRSADGILSAGSVPVPMPGFWQHLEELMEGK